MDLLVMIVNLLNMDLLTMVQLFMDLLSEPACYGPLDMGLLNGDLLIIDQHSRTAGHVPVSGKRVDPLLTCGERTALKGDASLTRVLNFYYSRT